MEGHLRKNQCGRWEIVDNSGNRIEITSGDLIEVQVGETWIKTRIECGMDGYYAAVPGLKLFQGQKSKIEGY